jgi:carbamoyltransferase
MKDTLNLKIKFREGFRPFAPVCLEEEAGAWFHLCGTRSLPHMLYTVESKNPEMLGAVTHINKTCRLQTVNRSQNDLLYNIISEFYKITGVPVLVNTSFNLRGEPIVSNASDAMNTFNKSNIDMVVFNGEVKVVRC